MTDYMPALICVCAFPQSASARSGARRAARLVQEANQGRDRAAALAQANESRWKQCVAHCMNMNIYLTPAINEAGRR